jgi:hypothetical protein
VKRHVTAAPKSRSEDNPRGRMKHPTHMPSPSLSASRIISEISASESFSPRLAGGISHVRRG